MPSRTGGRTTSQPYLYVRNDPVNKIDPDGRFWNPLGWLGSPEYNPPVDFSDFYAMSALYWYAFVYGYQPPQPPSFAPPGGGGFVGPRPPGFVSVSNPSKTGPQQDRISTVLNWISANIDDDCAEWLSGIKNMIPQVLGNPANPDSVAIGHGDFQANIAAFTNNNASQTDLPAGYAMAVNNSGAFFSSAWTVAGYSGGSSQVQAFILLHEFAHLLDAAGFVSDFGSQTDVNSNDKLVQQNCAKTIKAAKNIP
jgi:hypothetical protein